MRCHRRLVRTCLLVLVTGLVATESASSQASNETLAKHPAGLPRLDRVRWDWHFRESLVAVRDWEDTLAKLASAKPTIDPAPLLPVPEDGSWVTWPNPVPLRLVPPRDRGVRVAVRWTGKAFEVRRAAACGKVTTEQAAGDKPVLGIKHPGGGGKDHWYHGYTRRFDALTQFRPVVAPFALKAPACLDLVKGDQHVRCVLRNVTGRPLKVDVVWRLAGPSGIVDTGKTPLSLPPAESGTFEVLPHVRREGGCLLLISLACDGKVYRIPLLTHVESVSAVLTSIEQILGDHPDRDAATRLASMRRQGKGLLADGGLEAGRAWRRLFERASDLRDRLLRRRINFERLIIVKRKPYTSEQPFMDAHHLPNPTGGGIYQLAPVRPDGRLTPVVDSLGEGIYRDVHLHWRADRFLFAFGNGSDRWDSLISYNLYEAGLDDGTLRQLTRSAKNDCEPFYLPGGQIGFTSDRPEHYVMCGGDRHAPLLHVMESDGSNVRQLSFNVFNDFNPTVMPDGRILYSRWEYNERSVTSLHNPFTMNPDGTMVAPFYGNATIRPNVVMFPRPIPGTHKIMALFTGHHGQTHGPIGVIDIARGRDWTEPLTVLTPGIPITGEKAQDSRHGWCSDPVPLSETTYLCSFTPTVLPWVPDSWAVYVGDRHGNLGLIYRDPEISCCEPVPIVPRDAPHPRPPAPADTDSTAAEARVLLVDAYEGQPDVKRGTARYLRILEDVPRKGVPRGGVVKTAGTLIFTIKRVLGTVPVESDGSAYFVVPANRNLYFELLDADQREIQRMRSVICFKPGETQTCIGCHESRNTSPPNRPVDAIAREPSRPAPPPWGTRIVSYLRDVQPVINKRCVRCHAYARHDGRPVLTDDLTDQFVIGYEELLRHITVAISDRWDHPDDVYPRPAYTYGSKVSPLIEMLEVGHHDVTLTEDERLRLIAWVDTNGVYYDRYASRHWPKRQIFVDAYRKPLQAVFAKRCTSCHGSGRDTWWLSLNRRAPSLSRMLQAPLARSDGGWGRCDETVFADRHDADYQTMLGLLTRLRRELDRHPREDLLSLLGTPAADQVVELPPPPKATPALASALPDGNWVWLSDLRWASAKAGWTPNNDGKPRVDRDIRGDRLRLDGKRYRKGIGTHAPSEITYATEGKYDRFVATIGGAESGGTVVFQVFGDDKKLFDSGLMHGLKGTRDVAIDLRRAKRLRLVVTDGGNNYTCDMANWAGARLRKRADATARR